MESPRNRKTLTIINAVLISLFAVATIFRSFGECINEEQNQIIVISTIIAF